MTAGKTHYLETDSTLACGAPGGAGVYVTRLRDDVTCERCLRVLRVRAVERAFLRRSAEQ